ncbi:hypothetical protein D5S18_08635 [Nocardia panacis]|uniref:Uncharacterized protein n=1 Tax=Nocardia panacis TaxID=2340916 RepID=A0A3A4KS66_9NOCA|nr:hypothetical protein [Nocardia panacis]RJO76386.1 hypothetical protein D5S18_08635 [Nocardia panacis]
MNHRTLSRLFVALAACSIIAAPVAQSAVAAAVPMHHQPPPGSAGPRDDRDWREGGPPDRDRHCDHNGYWHNDDNDPFGHHDDRCPSW